MYLSKNTQNKIIRFVLDMHPREHIGTSHFKKLGWLCVEQRVAYLKLNLMHKIVHGQAPSYLTSTIVTRQNVHSYNTRLGKTSVFISSGSKLYQSSFQYSASKLWNNIPCDIRNVVSNNTFKRMVKSHLHSIFVNRNESDFIYI